MRHRNKTRKFKFGKDSNEALRRKLSRNLILQGKITTTLTKTKFLKSQIERLVHKAKKNSGSTVSSIQKVLGDKEVTALLIHQVAPLFQDVTGGFVRIVRLGSRQSDGTEMARLEWTRPVVLSRTVKEKKPKKEKIEKPVKKETKKAVRKTQRKSVKK